jgi:hypothetical protein
MWCPGLHGCAQWKPNLHHGSVLAVAAQRSSFRKEVTTEKITYPCGSQFRTWTHLHSWDQLRHPSASSENKALRGVMSPVSHNSNACVTPRRHIPAQHFLVGVHIRAASPSGGHMGLYAALRCQNPAVGLIQGLQNITIQSHFMIMGAHTCHNMYTTLAAVTWASMHRSDAKTPPSG